MLRAFVSRVALSHFHGHAAPHHERIDVVVTPGAGRRSPPHEITLRRSLLPVVLSGGEVTRLALLSQLRVHLSPEAAIHTAKFMSRLHSTVLSFTTNPIKQHVFTSVERRLNRARIRVRE